MILSIIKKNPVGTAVGLSFVSHIFLFTGLHYTGKNPVKVEQNKKVTIKIQEKKKEKPKEIPPKSKKVEKIPKKPKKNPNLMSKSKRSKKKTAKPKKKPKPVQGLSKESFTKTGKSGFVAPAGNTTLMKDTGQRLSIDEIEKITEDLSARAILIRDSLVVPPYTEEAEEAELQGVYPVSVYVDAKGVVLDAELDKKIGYGMDKLVIQSMKNAKFVPRKNEAGVPISGWVTIKYNLELE